MPAKYMTLREASAALGVSENTVRAMFDRGEIGGDRTTGRQHRRYLRADVLALVAKRNVQQEER